MGVLWVHEKPGGKSGGQGERGANDFHNEWLIKCDTPLETRLGVLSCGSLPEYGSPHPENMLATCTKTDARQHADDPFFWDAQADWAESPRSGRDPKDDQKQPDMRRPRWSAKYVPFPLARFLDYEGQLLADAAGTPFDPPPDMPIYAEEITIFQYEAVARRTFKRGFMGRANADVWQGAAIGEALIDDISTEDEYIQGQYWWPTTYRILIKPFFILPLPLNNATVQIGGWDPEMILNAGPLAWVQDSVTHKWTKEPVRHSGFYDGRPALLYSDGEEILPNPDTKVLSANPIFGTFHTKKTATFAALNLVPPPGWEDE